MQIGLNEMLKDLKENLAFLVYFLLIWHTFYLTVFRKPRKYSQDSRQRTSTLRASPFNGRNLNNRFFLYIIHSEQRGNSNTRYTSVHWPAFGAEKFRTTAEIDEQRRKLTTKEVTNGPHSTSVHVNHHSLVFDPTWQLVMTRVKPLYSTRRPLPAPQGGQQGS